MRKKLLLIDGNSLVYRAYYATAYSGNMLRAVDNTPTNAVYTFVNMLNSILNDNQYYSIVVAFDYGKKTFRHDTYAEYKAGRSKTPDELIIQMPIVKQFLSAYNIDWIEMENYEADDLIGCLVQDGEKAFDEINILSSDNDLLQLISDKTKVHMVNQGVKNIDIYNKEKLYEKWNLTPNQIIDLKGLKGDSSDNLKGIPGIGEKTALELLSRYQTLENIIANAENLSSSLKNKIEQHYQDALMCKQIATIYCDLNLKYNFKEFVPTNDKLIEFYLKYNINSLANRLEKTQQNINEAINFEILNQWNDEYNDQTNAVILQLYEDNYHTSAIIGIAVSNTKGNFYLSYENFKNDQSFLKFLNNKVYQKLTYDVKATIVALWWKDIVSTEWEYDMMLAGYVFNPNTKCSFDNYLNLFAQKQIISDEQFFGKGAKKIKLEDIESKSIAQFVTSKSYWIFSLYEKVIMALKNSQQYDLYYEIEFPTALALADMEFKGTQVDLSQLDFQTRKVKKIVDQLALEINTIAQYDVNPNSPKQLAKLLYQDLKLTNRKKESTAQEVLEEIKNEHPIINVLLDYRKYQKLYSTYLEGMNKYLFYDNKVHTIYKQTLTNTGRLSSVEPNMQNISTKDEIQREVRKIFIPDNRNNILLSCDYSQIELRILAHVSKDEQLINCFNNDEDIHKTTAMKIFNLQENQVTSNHRRIAKSVNFGIIYGISDFGLANELGISKKEAKEIIDNYFEKFPTIKGYINEQIEFCQNNNYVKTLYNRKRYVPEISSSNHMIKEFGKRIAMNMPIQGTAADIMKIAIKDIYQAFKIQNLKSYMIAQIHDELIFEVFKDELEKVQKIVRNLMENVAQLLIKLKIEMKTGQSWYELK